MWQKVFKKIKSESGLGLIGILLIIGILILTAGGVVVWQKKVSPTPTPTPTPTEVCRTDDDCPRGYWCPAGPGGPMAGGGYGGGTGYCVKECRVDSDCGVGGSCQDYTVFQGDVGVGIRKGCQTTSVPSPKLESTFPTEYSCNADSDCVLKDRPYCCGERLGYYKWCYPENVEPETISCEGVGSCPGLAGSAKSCLCQNGKCVAIF